MPPSYFGFKEEEIVEDLDKIKKSGALFGLVNLDNLGEQNSKY